MKCGYALINKYFERQSEDFIFTFEDNGVSIGAIEGVLSRDEI